MAAPIPKKIGKYDVIDVVGKGGMGVVYRAKDPFLDRMVAIKIMTISYADYPDLLQRFYREAKATANLQHPNIVTVYELGEHEGSPYLAMQYLEGASLEVMLRSGQGLSLLQKIDIIIQACHGLSYAHQKGIVHRDIKPGNIMVLKDGTVKIVDFGIARIGDTNFTRTGQFMGSLNYMSLEQLNDKLQVDQRTDVYSTGVVLYQILTGALPFEAESTGATLMKILNENPAPFSKYISGFPPEIETITFKALAKDRDQRYSSADDLAIELSQLADSLKVEQIEIHMRQAEALLQQNNLFQANNELLAVLKLDKQHTKASAMLRTLRKQIEKEQSAERSRQLREQAEEAFGREDFEPALGYVEQALQIDTNNTELQSLKSKVQAAKAEIEHLRQVMQRAENAHRAGNLDTARQAIEEVLSRRPNDTRVKSLHRLIQKELDDRMRQKRMENLLEAARKEMSGRRYTAAFDILKEAEKVDPEAPALRSLFDSLNAARDQEERRNALDQLTRSVEHALNTDDPQTALKLLTEGLQKFPNETALLKLKDLAETQNQTAQVKSFVKERIAAAREILNAGNAAGALKVLQEALAKAPGNPHLESLVAIAQERIAQDRDEQERAKCLHQANDAIGKKNYDQAIRVLEDAQIKFTASPEVDNLLRFAREQQSKDAKKKDLDAAAKRAQEFLKTQEYTRAIDVLEPILKNNPDEELTAILEEARRRRDALNKQIAAAIARGNQFISEGSPAKAVEFLQAQPTVFRRNPEFSQLVDAATKQSAEAARRQAEAAAKARAEETARAKAEERAKAQEAARAKAKPPEQFIEDDAPEPAKTMIWSTAAPPEEIAAPAPEKPGPPAQKSAPPIPKGKQAKPGAPKVQPVPKPAAPSGGISGKLIGIGAAVVVLLAVVVYAVWPRKPETTTTPIPITPTQPGNTQPNNPPPPPAVAENGTLSIQTTVASVDVFVDNLPKQTTSGTQLQIQLPVGEHSVRVAKDQYAQLPAKTVRITKDQTTPVTFSLAQLTVKPGFLEITGPAGATVRIDNQTWGNIAQDGKARVQVEPKPTYSVQIQATGADPWTKAVGPVAADQTLRVVANLTFKAPTVDSFNVPNEIAQGQNARLTWKTSNATSVDIEGVGQNLGPNDSRDIPVNQNTTFVLTARGPGGTATARAPVIVKVIAKAPTIASFSVSSTNIRQGDSVTLQWSTNDTQSVSIDGVGSGLPPSGSRQVAPSQSTTFKLIATGAGGLTASANAPLVNVEARAEAPKAPSTPDPNTDVAAIGGALSRLSSAYATQLVEEVKKEWVGMTREQERALKNVFSNQGLKAVAVDYGACNPAQISGDSAIINCTETMSWTANGRREKHPLDVAINLKKVSGTWRVNTKMGR